MNKKLILLGSIAASAIATVSPITLTSCAKINHKYDDLTKEIKQKAIEEFIALSKVYRPSFQTRAICDYLKNRIREIDPSIKVEEDKYRSLREDIEKSSGNLHFDVPANDESLANNHEFVIQAHMDMVPSGDIEQMETNGVDVFYDEQHQLITSKDKKTSLGADDGIGLGIILAMLQNKNFKHGPLKYIITADEEQGMSGAEHFGEGDNGPQEILSNSYALLNVDNEIEGQIVTSTAGGLGIEFTDDEPSSPITSSYNKYTLTVDGLKGGHSGDQIGKGRANAIKIANDVLLNFKVQDRPIQLISFTSPSSTATNVIPTKAVVSFTTNVPKQEIESWIEIEEASLKTLYPIEDGVSLQLDDLSLGSINTAYGISKSHKIIDFINQLLYGVISWKRIEDQLPETSANIGPISLGWYMDDEEIKNHSFNIQSYSRSCNNSHMEILQTFYRGLSREILGEDHYNKLSLYYGWPGDTDQTYINFIKDSYKSFGVEWTTDDPHAGLEISWFKHFNPNLYLTSIGPTIMDAHTVNETLYVDSLDSTIKVILASVDLMKK